MANTRETLGDEATLRGLIENTLETFEENGVTSLPSSALRYNKGLKKVVFPAVTSLGNYSFATCTNLEEADFSALNSIPSSCFSNDSKLKHLILRKSSRINISGRNSLEGTKIVAYDGAVYVPSDLLATYKADSKWKNYFITTIDRYPTTVYETIDDSWSTIVQKITAGTAYSEYGQGATKSFTWSDGTNSGTAYAQLIAVGKDELVDGSDNSKLTTWIIKNIAFQDQMNANNTNSNGWGACALRTKLQGMLSNFDSFFQTNIKAVKKTYYDRTTASTLSTGTGSDPGDKLWIPSAREMFGGSSYEDSGCNYTDFFSDSEAQIKCYILNPSVYWLRTAAISGDYSFGGVSVIGNAINDLSSSQYASKLNGVVFGFCI